MEKENLPLTGQEILESIKKRMPEATGVFLAVFDKNKVTMFANGERNIKFLMQVVNKLKKEVVNWFCDYIQKLKK